MESDTWTLSMARSQDLLFEHFETLVGPDWRCEVQFRAHHVLGMIVVDWLPKCDGIKSIEDMGPQRYIEREAHSRFEACRESVALVHLALKKLQSMAEAEKGKPES